MKIVSLRAENVKRLSVVEVTPKGALVEITGKNGQGKTSVLDSIWWALTGQQNIQKSPIRKGQESAKIKLNLGELVVTRTFGKVADPAPGEKEFTTKVTVTAADGQDLRSPQGILDALAGSICFDPLEFERMDDKGKFNALRAFVADIDFEKIEGQNRTDMQLRVEAGRDRDKAKAAAAVIDVPDSTPDEMIDEDIFVQRLTDAGRINGDIETRKANRAAAADKITDLRQRAQDLRAQAAKIEEEAGELIAKADETQKKLEEAPPLPEPVDTAQVQQALAEAKATNANVRKKQEKGRHLAIALDKDTEWKGIDDRMKAREKAKQEAIKAAKMPAPGLGFGDGFITLNGLPFAQASDAERLRVSCAIAMASNPKLRVIRVRDGSLLDSDSIKLLGEMATEGDFQIWLETVDSSGRPAVVLEDGHVKEERT